MFFGLQFSFPYFSYRCFKMHEGNGVSDVIDDSVNNGLGFQPIDIINDHLPELQWLRSIIRKCRRRRQTLLSRLLFPLSSTLDSLVLSFLLSRLSHLRRNASPSSSNSRMSWDIFFFCLPSWRFAKIHSSTTSEGAKRTPQKLLHKRKKERGAS